MNTAKMMVLSAMTAMAIGCGGGAESAPDGTPVDPSPATSTEPAPAPAATPAPAPTAAQQPPATPAEPPKPAKTRMYVVDNTGKLSAYALPLTRGSAPLATVGAASGLKSPRNIAITPANDRIFVADNAAKKVFGFDLPLTSASTPVVTIDEATYAPHGVAVDAAGNLWVSKFSGVLSRYDAPITSASTPAASLSTGDSANLYDVVVDAHDTVFVASLKGLPASNTSSFSSSSRRARRGPGHRLGPAKGTVGRPMSGRDVPLATTSKGASVGHEHESVEVVVVPERRGSRVEHAETDLESGRAGGGRGRRGQ